MGFHLHVESKKQTNKQTNIQRKKQKQTREYTELVVARHEGD